MIILDKIYKTYENKDKLNKYENGRHSANFCALENISIKVKKGEKVGVIGLNRSGKTTLLSIIAGITKPTSGTIEIGGKVAPFFDVGSTFSNELTARENVILLATSLKENSRYINSKIDEIKLFSEVNRFDTPLKHFSKGMKARVCLSMILFLNFDILLLDETFSGCDLPFMNKLFEKFESYFLEKEITLILVSHNKDVLTSLCNRLILLEEGKIIKDDDTNLVYEYYIEKYTSR
jgi:ABC-type polysaccharide/polyol phosphate transport system ATPase subunit